MDEPGKCETRDKAEACARHAPFGVQPARKGRALSGAQGLSLDPVFPRLRNKAIALFGAFDITKAGKSRCISGNYHPVRRNHA